MKQAGVLCLFNMYERQIHALSPHQIDDLTTFVAQFLPRDIKAPPSPATPLPQASQQQQQHSQHHHAADEEKGKLALRSAPHTAASSSSNTSSSVNTEGMSAYLETLKPLNTDLR